MKAKATIALIAVLTTLIVVLVRAALSKEPVQVSGDLTEREVADICAAVQRFKAPPTLLPDLSMESIRKAPGLIWERVRYRHPKIWKLEARNNVFVAALGRPTLDTTTRACVFWAVFRETNGWKVEFEAGSYQ